MDTVKLLVENDLLKRETKYLKELALQLLEEYETSERYAIEEYNRILLDERDEQMTEKAREYMNSDKTVFMAVGLAHVLGDGGIIDILRNDGYVIERVDFK